MPASYHPDRRLRASAALAALAVQAGLAYLLISGLAWEVAADASRRFDVLSVPLPPPTPSPQPSPTPSPSPQPVADDEGAPKNEEGAAGRRGEATQVVAPEPPIVLVPPPPIVTAPVAGAGNDPTTGAADHGTGTGAGGEGTGRGGGGAGGSGQGAGGGRPAQRIAGALRDSDYPEEAADAQAAGTVFVRFRIGTDGRARGCEVVRSSGSPILDETTCRLIERRFRYRAARDDAGRPIESTETTNFTWGLRTR